METVITAARLIDGTGGMNAAERQNRERAAVVVRDGRIAEVRDQVPADRPEGARVIDLGERTLLPGLIDTHLHFAGNLCHDGQPLGSQHPVESGIRSAAEARLMLEAGFTTVRDCGS